VGRRDRSVSIAWDELLCDAGWSSAAVEKAVA
jgi:hypothetical protein